MSRRIGKVDNAQREARAHDPGSGGVAVKQLLKPPSPKTLAKYGLTEEAWWRVLAGQGGTCAVCLKVPATGRLCIDHEHVRGWKKMPPERRRQFVRGLLCWYCNHAYVGRAITVAKAQNVVEYLNAHRRRLDAALGAANGG